MSKVNVTVNYPVTSGVMGVHKVEIASKICINKLVSFLKRQIKLSHMEEIHVHVARWDDFKFYPASSRKMITLVEGDEIHLLSEACGVFEEEEEGEGDMPTPMKCILFDLPDLDDDDTEEMKVFLNEVVKKSREIGNDGSLEGFVGMYMMYHSFLPKTIDATDPFIVGKTTAVLNFMKVLREGAREKGIEEEMSRRLTGLDYDPFHKILRKHGMHKFKYVDDMNRAVEMCGELLEGVEDGCFMLLDPRRLLCNEEMYQMSRRMCLGRRGCGGFKAYFAYIDNKFPKPFRLDYAEWNKTAVSNHVPRKR